MSTRREYYKSLAERLGVPHELEAIPISLLIQRSPRANIYQVVSDMSRRAEAILDELTQELRQKLQELDTYEDAALRDEEASRELQQEIRQWVERYRGLPKPTLIALWEKLYGQDATSG